jgi:ADP-ribose pyrophosphatase
MQSWKTVSRRTILDYSKFLSVEEHTIQLPDGQIIEEWPWVVTPDFINVVAITEAGKFLFFRQTKYSIVGTTLAPVGGYLEPGEDPLTAAQRELREETGYAAPSWQAIGQFPIDGNRGVGKAYFYIAQGAQRITEIDADDLEEQELLRLTRPEVEAALDAGEFKLLPWATIVALALRQIPAN